MAGPVRLVELLASLSLASDAADGFAPQTTIRSAVLAAALAEATGQQAITGDVVIGALIRHLGCTGFAVEEAHQYGAGDDVALRSTMAAVDFADPEDAVRRIERGFAPGAAPDLRRAAIGTLLGEGPTAEAAHHAAQCDAAERLAALLPIPSGARTVASHAFERWDGRGGPYGVAGTDISLVARLVEVAYQAELFRSREGRVAALEALRARRGGMLDPSLVDGFVEHAPDLFATVDDTTHSSWDALLHAEPEPHCRLSLAQIDDVALAFARFADLKSAWFTGHSESVATLARDAATLAPTTADDELTLLHRAALLHDLGRAGIATGTWDLPRPLSPPERDRVELHARETERILGSTALLADIADLAGAAHERLDGSGYHRGRRANDLGAPARYLAVADVVVALGADRPHRPALDRDSVVALVRDLAVDGHLDRSAVETVLEVATGTPPAALTWPAGLTDREVTVVRLLARGATNKDVARELGITPKTVAHHVAHVYDKTGCRSRAGVTLFAVEHGLASPAGSRP